MLNLTTLKDFVGGSEEWASYLEKLAIGYINSHLWYNIEDAENIYEADRLPTEEYLPQYPITSITKIERNTGDNFAPVWETVDSAEYRAIGTAGKIINKYYIWDPVKITYRTGYLPYIADWETGGPQETTCPAEVETAINFLVKFYFNSSKPTSQNDLKSETVDGDKTEFHKPDNPADNTHIQALLSKFERYDVVA